MKAQRIAIGIPTRNRAELVVHALTSVVGQSLPPEIALDVFVSDNSTAPHERETLQRFVAGLGDTRVRRIQPPGDLPMVEHWNFLLAEMLDRSDADRFLFLTDRMFFKHGALRALGAALERCADSELLAYGIDTLHDLEPPFRLQLQSWSGECRDLASASALDAVSRAYLYDYLPKMLNSVASRALLTRLCGHYGSVFSSIAPDFAFCFRALSMLDRYAFLDRSLIVQHGLARSNGRSMTRGVPTADSRDFMARLGAQYERTGFAALIPELQTTANVIMHEYASARAAAPQPECFPEIDPARYMALQWNEVLQMEDPSARAIAVELLRRHAHLWPESPHFFDKAALLETAAAADGKRRWHAKLRGIESRKIALRRARKWVHAIHTRLAPGTADR